MPVSDRSVLRLTGGSRSVDGAKGAVVYQVETSHWMKLNDSGKLILGLLDGHRSISDIVTKLCQDHGYPEDIIREWVTGFITTLWDKGYLENLADSGNGTSAGAEAAQAKAEAAAATASGPSDDYRLDVLYLHVTGRCNFSCPYCYASAGKQGPDLDLELCRRVIGEAAALGATKLAISGGEPTLRKDLGEIVKAGKEAGLVTQLLTNGSLITTKERATEITQNLDLFQVSIDGWNDETNRATRGEGAFDRARGALGYLKEIGYKNVAAAATPYALNSDDIGQVIRLAPELGVRLLRFNQLIPSGRAAEMSQERFAGEKALEVADAVYTHYFKLQQEWTKEGKTLDFGIKVAGDPANTVMSRTRKLFCGVGVSTLSVGCDGMVYPCAALQRSELAIGNVAEESLATIHSRSIERHSPLIVDSEKDCKDCDVRHFCGGGCRAVHYALKGRLDGRSPQCAALKDRILTVMRRTVA